MSWVSRWWCRHMHGTPFLPVHGRYLCPQCLQEFRIDWNRPKPQPAVRAEPTGLNLEKAARL